MTGMRFASGLPLALALTLLFTVGCGRDEEPPGPGVPGDAGSCALGCVRGFQCGGISCQLNPSGMWKLTITSGTIATQGPTGAWDAFGGAPDPVVCVTVNGNRGCTRTQQDTFTPIWNESTGAVTATSLLAGVTVEIIDEDISANDGICAPGIVPVREQNFLSGTWAAGCPTGSFQAILAAQ